MNQRNNSTGVYVVSSQYGLISVLLTSPWNFFTKSDMNFWNHSAMTHEALWQGLIISCSNATVTKI